MRRKGRSRRSHPSAKRSDAIEAAGARFGELHSVVMAGCVALAPFFPDELYAATLIPPQMVSEALATLVEERFLIQDQGMLRVNSVFAL